MLHLLLISGIALAAAPAAPVAPAARAAQAKAVRAKKAAAKPAIAAVVAPVAAEPALILHEVNPQARLEALCEKLKDSKKAVREAAANQLESSLPAWIQAEAVFPTSSVRACLPGSKLQFGSDEPFVRAWADLAHADRLPALLANVPAERARAYRSLTATATASLLARGDLKGLAALEKAGVLTIAQRARLAFSRGDYAASARLLETVSEKDPEFVASRLDLAWAYAHLGRYERLRGLVAHVNRFVPASQRPEGRVLSAISQIQACDYSATRAEIDTFQKELTAINGKLQAARESSLPPGASAQLVMLERAAQGLAGTKAPAAAELASKLKAARARAWDGYEALLSEAILKMRFVRVELLAHLHRIDRKQGVASSLGAGRGEGAEDGKLTFSDTNDYWPDEAFKLSGEREDLCPRYAVNGGTNAL